MSKSLTAGMIAHVAQEVTTLAMLWQMTRVDGTNFFFTDLDRDIVFDGNAYIARTGFIRTGITSDIAFSVDNLDVAGLFDSVDIDENELRGGLFDGAEIKISLINYEVPADGLIKMRRGILGHVTATEKGWFKAELRGLNQNLQQTIGNLYSPHCRVDLGDPNTCNVGINPPINLRNHLYTTETWVRAFAYTTYFAITNPGAESGVTGWTNELGTLQSIAGASAEDSNYFTGGAADAETIAYQDLLVPAGAETTAVDAGQRRLRVNFGQNAAGANNDPGQVIVDFYDGTPGTLISSITTTLQTLTAWTAVELTGNIPTLTRTIRLKMRSLRSTGTTNDARFDAFTAQMEAIDTTLAQYGDRIFQASVVAPAITGTTRFGLPQFNFTLDATTIDGAVTWVCKAAWMKQFTVTSVTSNQVFVAAIDGFANDWFRYGAVTWLTGNNTGISMEVRKSEDDTPSAGSERITLFLPMNFNIQIGDVFTIYPGCDKTRNTCAVKFFNAINFRGEPDVPGTDYLSSYPDAG